MFDTWFPHWSTLKKLIFLKASALANALVTLTGQIVSFLSPSVQNIQSLTVALSPIQSGTGDPSPDNVRPISGHSEVNVWRTGANLAGAFTGNRLPTGDVVDGVFTSNPFNAPSGFSNVCTLVFPDVLLKAGVTYYLSTAIRIASGTGGVNQLAIRSDSNTISSTTVSMPTASGEYQRYIKSVTPEEDVSVNRLYMQGRYTTDCVYQVKDMMICLSDDGDFAPLTLYTVSITIPTPPGTVYGGTLDVVTGVLKARPYYASYNGETLVGPWVSSMDKYVAGTTPTTGAQVVDMGGTETVVQLSATQLQTLANENHVWTDAGEVTLTAKGITEITP